MKNLFGSIDKRTMIIGGVCLAVVVALVIFFAIYFSVPKQEKNPAEDTTVPADTTAKPEFDTSVVGDGGEDPENTEPDSEEGSEVDATDVKGESGRSLGIDVSKWQGKIDWSEVKAAGMDFAYIRIGYRGSNGKIYKDDNADYNIQEAEKAGLLIGVYFFTNAVDEKEAAEEARWTLEAIEGYPVSYPVVYDCEGFRSKDSRMHLVSRVERTKNALAFLKTVTDAGYEAMLYGARNELSDPVFWNISEIEKEYKVWVAQYPKTTYPEKEFPDYTGSFDAWQYTNRGIVSGISGGVDMVVCYFEREKSAPKNENKRPSDAKAPLTDEEKLYTEVNEKVTAKDITNLRESATTKSNIVKALRNGETVVRTGIGSNGWSRLLYNGKTVYAITSYLTTDLSVNTEPPVDQDVVDGQNFSPRSDSVTAKEVVNLRARPSTSSEIVGTLEKGTYLERTAVSDKGWSRLTYEGGEVYAVTNYLTTEVFREEETTAPETEASRVESMVFEEVDQQVTAKIQTNLRTLPTTEGSEVVYTLPNGEYIQRIGISDSGWSKLLYNGEVVYAVSSYLEEKED